MEVAAVAMGRQTAPRRMSALLASTCLTTASVSSHALSTHSGPPSSPGWAGRHRRSTLPGHRPPAYPAKARKAGIRGVECAARTRAVSSGDYLTLEDIAESLKGGGYENVLVVAGAGVSCGAGIPDFRSPGSGLYDNLHKYDLPYPEAIFDVGFYRANPLPFVTLAREIWPGVKYRPTPTHCFFRLLEEKGILRRVYTQNIDGLEAVAGVSEEKLVECHGHFRSAGCTRCGARHDAEDCKSSMLDGGVAPTCDRCGGLVKPSIVFFGEVMPGRFSELVEDDAAACDLVIVVGTSLLVAPVANVPEWVDRGAHRLLVNREMVGSFHRPTDVFSGGDCDDSVRKLCRLAGWEEELECLYSDISSK